jgi:flotillin
VDRLVGNSETLSTVKDTFFNSDPEYFKSQLKTWTSQFGLTSDDLKNLTVAAALAQMIALADEGETKGALQRLLNHARRMGVHDKRLDGFTAELKS